MKKLKIAIYSGIIPSTTFIENLIHAVANEGHEVLLFGVKKTEVNYRQPNIRVFVQPSSKVLLIVTVMWQRFLFRIREPEVYRRLSSIIQARVINRGHPWLLWVKYLPVIRSKPDIFHLQWAKGVEEWMFLKELLGVKLVLSLRGTHITNSPLADETVASSYRRCFPEIDGFHAVSKEISKEVEQYGALSDKVKVVYSAVDMDAIQQYKRENAVTGFRPLKLISIGRMHWIKGYHYSLDAIRLLLDSNVDVHYTIIGWGNQEEFLFQVKDLGLEKHVTLIKKMAHDKVLVKMQQSDLLILPSVEEGIANVVLEAMAMGIPVLSSDCGGMKEVIRDGENGYLFRNRDSEDMLHKLRLWMNEDSEKKNAMIQQAKSDIRERHGIDRLGKEMSAFYETVFNPAGHI